MNPNDPWYAPYASANEMFFDLLEKGRLVRLPVVAALIKPYRVYANYQQLYRMARDGDIMTIREPGLRYIYAVGNAAEIAEEAQRRMNTRQRRRHPVEPYPNNPFLPRGVNDEAALLRLIARSYERL